MIILGKTYTAEQNSFRDKITIADILRLQL